MRILSCKYEFGPSSSKTLSFIPTILKGENTQLRGIFTGKDSMFYNSIVNKLYASPILVHKIHEVNNTSNADSMRIEITTSALIDEHEKAIEKMISESFIELIKVESISIDISSNVRLISAKLLGSYDKIKADLESLNSDDAERLFLSLEMRDGKVTVEYLPSVLRHGSIWPPDEVLNTLVDNTISKYIA